MQTNPFMGVGLHAIGAFSAATCYTPQKQTKLWAWEIYWIAQATCAWLILPIVGALLTVPDYFGVLAECPKDAMLRSFGLGVLYGVGGLTFGLGIRYIGFSLNYAIAIGVSAAIGTLAPLIWHPNKGFVWTIVEKFQDLPGYLVLSGIVISFVGILFCGWAGVLRETSGNSSSSGFAYRRGIPLAILAGTLSAVFNFALIAGDPLKEVALKAGTNELLSMNAIYPFSHGGAWVTNASWCIVLMLKNGTRSQLVQIPGKGKGTLSFYYLMALLSGGFWYFQFFFYGMGNARMGEKYEFTSWALHMAMLILFSNVYGWLFREWEGSSSRPRRTLHVGMAIIVVATLLIAYGNHMDKLAMQQ